MVIHNFHQNISKSAKLKFSKLIYDSDYKKLNPKINILKASTFANSMVLSLFLSQIEGNTYLKTQPEFIY